MADAESDPPLLPYPDSTTWYETGPEPIGESPDLATLIVQVGMAANAIAGQMRFGVLAVEGPAAQKNRDLLLALVGSCALINESIKLVRNNRPELVALASGTHIASTVLAEVETLCAWAHPANEILKRARHEIGFHWTREAVGASVKEYGRNERIVWVEFAEDGIPVHRLASEVLAHALLGLAHFEQEPAAQQQAMTESFQHVKQALNTINEFFVACVYGYLQRWDADQRGRSE